MSLIKEFIVQGVPVEIVVYEQRSLVCKSDGHNKFWVGTRGFAANSNTPVVVMQWGKIGNVGHTELKKFKHNAVCTSYFDDRLRDKKTKGYVDAEDEAFLVKNPSAAVSKVVAQPEICFAWDLF